MCVMEGLARVGVRELRQNLSVYLRRVRQGETLEVTERGEPVARLVPLSPGGSVVARLIAEGKARPPKRPWSTLGQPLETGAPLTISEALAEQRAERL